MHLLRSHSAAEADMWARSRTAPASRASARTSASRCPMAVGCCATWWSWILPGPRPWPGVLRTGP
eukprot:13396979-Alexandrium_andersonii.AAC.1